MSHWCTISRDRLIFSTTTVPDAARQPASWMKTPIKRKKSRLDGKARQPYMCGQGSQPFDHIG